MEECKVNLKRIMAALDLSAFSETTFAHALTLARALGGELVLLNVINSRGLETLDRIQSEGFNISREQYVNNVLADRSEEFKKDYLGRVGQVPVRLEFRVGIPWEQVLKAASELEVDMIVTGTKGHTNLAGVLFGSTAEKVFRRARCPVVSVRGPEHCRLPDA